MCEMTPSELADKLGGWWIDSEPSENRKIILKSLRFAADMEKLMESDDREIVFRRLSGGRIQLSTLWRENGELKIFNRVFSDSDIYSAARKAVEALEGNNEI